MSKKSDLICTNYVLDRTIESFYIGGPVALTRCGSRLFTNYGNNVKCVDFSSGKIRFSISAPHNEDEVTSFALSPCNEFLIVAYRNTLIVQFRLCLIDDAAIVERSWKSGHRGPIVCLDISHDSRLLATGSGDLVVKIFDLQAQYCTHTLKECIGCITCVLFSPSFHWIDQTNHHNNVHTTSMLLAYGDDTGKLFVRRLTPTSMMQSEINNSASDAISHTFSLNHHTSAVTQVVFGDDTTGAGMLFACGRDAVVSQWDGRRNFALKKVTPTFESLETMISCISDTVEAASVRHEQFLVTGDESGCLKIWSAKSGQCLKKINLSCKGPIKQILRSDALRCYLIVTFDHVILKMSIDDFKIEGRLIGRNDEIYDVSFCGETLSHVAVAANSSEIRLYNLDTCQCSLLTNGHSDSVLALDVAVWDPCLLASCSKDNSIAVWRLSDDKVDIAPLCTATGHTAQVGCVRFSRLKPRPNGSQPFVASISDDKTLKLWRLPLGISKNNASIAYNLSAATTVVAHEKDAAALDLSPNDRFIATGSMDKTIKIWCIDDSKKLTLSLVATINDHKRGVFDVRFSPTDQVLASASGDFTLKIFTLKDFSCLQTFEGHQATVLRVLFTVNGSQILSADSAGLLKLWTIKTNECVQTLDAHEDKIFALCSNSTGNRLVTGGSDARLDVWRDDTDVQRSAEMEEKRAKIEDQQRLANLMSRDSLRDDQISVLLNYVTEWNSNGRDYLVGQKMLAAILKCRSPEQLLKMPNIEKVVEGLLPYSQRHFERLSRSKQQAYFIDYTWSCMKLDGKYHEMYAEEEKKIKAEI